MPRPKSIPWEKRVQVFLAYRQTRGKVNPVANRYGVARSTVSVIVKEFVDMGFSEAPRVKVSEDLFQEMQQQHLISLVDLPRFGVGRLKLGPTTDSLKNRQDPLADPLPVHDESRWHLKGTKVEQVIEEARTAYRDYLRFESEKWQGLRLNLEEACQLPEQDWEITPGLEPHLFPTLKRRLKEAFFEGSFLTEPPSPSWLQWDLEPQKPEVLRLQGEPIGVGSAEDHQRIKQGVMAFLDSAFQKHQKHFFELERFRQDIELIDGILEKEVQAITEDTLRVGICPLCPYPEASQEQNIGPSASKRRKNQEGKHD